MNCRRNRKEIADKFETSLSNRSYKQDPASHESRWSNRVFRDEETGAIMIPTPEYMLGWNVNGTFNPSSNIIENKRERPNESYRKTASHEAYHAQGKGEYETRFLNNDEWMNYQ